MGGKTSTSTQTNTPPPQVMAAYTDLLAKANPIAATPYQPYMGGVNGTGMEQNQLTGFNNIAGLAGSSNGSFNNAAGALNATAAPTSSTVGQYMSPYIQGVVNSTMANMNEMNGQQQQGVLGNAIAQGAMGGNRVGVAQSELARQQNLANQQTIAGLYNGGYNTALSADQADKQANLQAGSEYANLGQTQMQTNLGQAAAQVGAGTQQQQYNYQQYQNQQSYPFQTTSWLANIVEGAGAGMGGTSTTTQPAGNTGAGILGGLLSLPWKDGGVVHSGARPQRATGGVIPYSGGSGIVNMNNNNPPGGNDNQGYVPQAATGTVGHSTMPTGTGVAPQQATNPLLQQGFGAMDSRLKSQYPSGLIAGLTGPALPTTAPIPTPNPMTGEAGLPAQIGNVSAPASTGILSMLGLASGGVARRHYDDGGAVDPTGDDPLLDNIRAFLGGNQSPAPEPLSDQQFSDRAGSGVVPPRQLLLDPGIEAPVPANARNTDPGISVAPTGVTNADPNMDVMPAGMAVGNNPVTFRPLPQEYADKGVTQDQWNSMNAPDVGSGVAAVGNSGVVPPLTSRTIADAPIAPSVPEYKSANAQKYVPMLNQVNDAAGLPPGYLAQTAYIESGFNPNADNGIAKGILQFTSPTARQYGLADPFNATASAQAAAKLGVENSKFLEGGLGRPPTAGEIYLAHQQGASGALNLLTHPDANASDIVGKAAVVNNGGSPDMTAGQFANLWTSRFSPVSPNSSSDATTLRTAGVLPPTDNTATGSTGGQTGVVSPFSNGQTPDANPQGRPYTTGIIDAVSGLLHGQMPNLSPDARMALMSAGFGMMASKSPNFLPAVGEGGQQGVKMFQERQQMARENALAQSNIGLNTAVTGKTTADTALAGQQLALTAQKTAADIAKTTADTAKTNVETAAQRYTQTPTNAGLLIRDVTQPNSSAHLITWSDLQNGAQLPDGSAPSVTAPPAANASTAATPPASAAATNAPVVAAPVQPVGPVPAGTQSQFVTKAPSNIPIDGRMMGPMGSVGSSVVQNETNDGLKAARTNYQASTASQLQLAEMKHDLAGMEQSAWTAPGPGSTFKTNVARAINMPFQMTGFGAPIDEAAVAANEDMRKQSTRLGFALSSTLGSGEAASIIERAVAAVPSAENSPEGFRRIIAGVEAGNQRANDYYSFLQDWSAKTGGSIKGADEYFNRVNPPEKYATSALLQMAVTPKTQADIDKAPAGTMFNINGQLMVK